MHQNFFENTKPIFNVFIHHYQDSLDYIRITTNYNATSCFEYTFRCYGPLQILQRVVTGLTSAKYEYDLLTSHFNKVGRFPQFGEFNNLRKILGVHLALMENRCRFISDEQLHILSEVKATLLDSKFELVLSHITL